MERSRLEMEFRNIVGKKFSLSLDEPREGLTSEEVREVMDSIVDKNIFFTEEGDIAEAVGARIVVTRVEELEI